MLLDNPFEAIEVDLFFIYFFLGGGHGLQHLIHLYILTFKPSPLVLFQIKLCSNTEVAGLKAKLIVLALL